MRETERILKDIELLRNKMIETAFEKGFTSNECIEASQRLDQLMNYYKKVCQDKHVTMATENKKQ